MINKILIITNNDKGLFRFRSELIEELLINKFEVIIVSPDEGYLQVFKDRGCKTYSIYINRRSMNPIYDFKTFIDIFRIIKKKSPDIVLTYTVKPNIYSGIICRLLNCRYICNITGLGSIFQKKGINLKLIYFLYKLSIKHANWVFIQNEEIYKVLKQNQLISNQVSIIPGSGVSFEQFHFTPISEYKNYHFLFAGRIMREKGVIELLEAANVIVNKYKNVYFNLVGMTDEKIDIQNYTNDHIIYHGSIENIIPYYIKTTCLIHPSYHEGMSNVILEACAVGRPCLVSDIPGCREIIENGYNGFTFEPKSSDAIVEAIDKFLLLSIEEIKEMGLNSRKIVEQKFDRKIVINEYLNKIKEMEKQ